MKRYLLIILLGFLLFFTGNSQIFTSEGTDFWIAFPPNNGASTLTIFISSNFTTSGNITSAFPGVDQSFNVVPGIATQIVLPSGVALTIGTEDKGIHITSNDPISVYGLNHIIASTDAYLALPVNALGLDYRIMSYTVDIPPVGLSCLSVVATQDGTNLSIFNHQTSNTSNVTLNQGQTYLLAQSGSGEDLTGSRVQSNYPVGVFGSSTIVDIPDDSWPTGDHIVEMMFPVSSWGKDFVTVPLAGRSNCGDIFRVLAAQDGTQVSVNGTVVATLNAGDYYQSSLTGYNSINTSKATLLAQYAKGGLDCGSIGDPLMMLIIPQDQFLTHYTVVNTDAGFFAHWINIVAPDYAVGNIYQDGILILSSSFVQIGTTNFYGAQLPVTAGSHTFNSTAPFGVSVYGWGGADSYGYPGGGCMAPVGTVRNITLSPDTSYGQLNVTNVCLTAFVTDNLNQPVAGVLVNFYVSGINPLVGNGYTDAFGNAQFCYTQTGVTPGTDHVYTEVFGFQSDTVVVIWSLTPPPCSNPVSGGTIGNDQTGCGSFTPSILNNILPPTGFAGNLEYKWQFSTTSSTTGFVDIVGSNNASYSPGSVTQTTWFKRIARVDCMTDWSSAVSSNTLEMIVVTPVIPTITIISDFLQVCQGGSVHLTATGVNGGTNPFYLWKVNGANAGTNSLTYSYVPTNGDVVTCTLTSSDTCTTVNPVTSNPITLTVNQNMPVSVSISASANPFCQGASVTFTATPTNGGAAPSYLWKVNGINAGSSSPAYTYNPASGDLVSCILTSNIACPTGNPATSNTITMVENTNSPVSVSINATANPVCSGTSVTFTATPTNGGTAPVYQWKVNGIIVGTNNPALIYTPLNGDCIMCVLTSNLVCASGNPATSNTICMTVNPNLPVSIAINASANPVCAGTLVIFTASPINPGTLPVYQWKVNGGIVGTSNLTYSYIPVSGDQISCILTSNAICPTGNPATSNTIIMTVNPNLPVSISINASNNPVCAGIPVTFTAIPTNGGLNPVFHWKVNGINVGPNSPTYQYTPANGDIINCILTSNVLCPTGNPATSNTITMNISSLPVVTFTRCFDSITTTTAQPFKLKGGIPLGGTYSGAGVTGGIFNPAIAGVGPHQIMYTYTNAALCAASATVTIVTIVTSVTTCGNPITDPRDNKTYQTAHIGNQCWLAEDLNYGTEISSTMVQRDNCVPEKYTVHSSLFTVHSYYQWDEIMNYDESISTQGLCPPGWHVPMESDWSTLFKNYTDDGFAASPLKYSGFSGFNALLNGTRHLNEKWDYPGFATFFWSSTAHGTDKAMAHGMNDPDPSVSAYPAFRTNAFSVRCLKD